jgi:hypothetical protein
MIAVDLTTSLCRARGTVPRIVLHPRGVITANRHPVFRLAAIRRRAAVAGPPASGRGDRQVIRRPSHGWSVLARAVAAAWSWRRLALTVPRMPPSSRDQLAVDGAGVDGQSAPGRGDAGEADDAVGAGLDD